MEDQKTKHVLLSTTQLAGIIGSSLMVYNIYGRLTGQGTIELTADELMALSTLGAPLLCTLWMMLRRMKGNGPLCINPKKVVK